MDISSTAKRMILLSSIGLFLVVTSIGYPAAYSEDNTIPSWIRNVALWWGQGEISDEDFFQLIQYLVEKEIIVTPNDNLLFRVQQLETELEQQSMAQNMNSINQIVDRGDFQLSLRQTDLYQEYYEALDIILTEQIDYLNQLVKLPYDISVIAEECQESNAFYDYQSRTIIFCYELLDEFYEVFSDEEYFIDISTDEVAEGMYHNIIETLYHELGHAMIDSWNIPITGVEENVADQFAVFLIWNSYDDESINDILYNVGSYYYVEDGYYEQDQSDVHSLDLQRFYNLSCYAYGFDKNSNQDLITDDWLPLTRSHNCEYEFELLVNGFTDTFAEYLIGDVRTIQ